MFNFTTTNVINSQLDFTTGLPLWSLQEKEDETTLNIKRINNFKKSNVVKIYKTEAVTPLKAKLCMSFPEVTDVKNGDKFRISIYIRLALSSQSSYYSNDMVFKGKPFSVEFAYKTDWATTLKKLEDDIKKYALLVYEKPLLKVTVDDTDITIEATDEYQRFYLVDIEQFDPKAYHGMGDFIVLKSISDLEEVTIEESETTVEVNADQYFAGREGFGTYEWLSHNLRLPTTMRTRVYATNADETPIPGALYNEYVIHYCVNRGILGNNAVGDLVKSMTTHVLYVNQNLLDKVPEGGLPEGWEAADIETALSKLAELEIVGPKKKENGGDDNP